MEVDRVWREWWSGLSDPSSEPRLPSSSYVGPPWLEYTMFTPPSRICERIDEIIVIRKYKKGV